MPGGWRSIIHHQSLACRHRWRSVPHQFVEVIAGPFVEMADRRRAAHAAGSKRFGLQIRKNGIFQSFSLQLD
jgi:hypothetical protein